MIDELRERIRAQHAPDFEFTAAPQVAFTAPSAPLRASRVALISTAGLHLEQQQPFDRETQCGDCSFRAVGAEDDLSRLRLWWDGEQQHFASQDLNCAFPLQLLAELRDAGEIGSVAARHYSFSGAIPDPRPLLEDSAPAVAASLRDDGVDVVVIAPS